MNVYRNLYVGESIKGKEKSILRKIKYRRQQLEIYHAAMLLQPLYFEKEPWIVGIAASEWEAYELVRKIAEEVHEATKTLEMKKYIQERI